MVVRRTSRERSPHPVRGQREVPESSSRLISGNSRSRCNSSSANTRIATNPASTRADRPHHAAKHHRIQPAAPNRQITAEQALRELRCFCAVTTGTPEAGFRLRRGVFRSWPWHVPLGRTGRALPVAGRCGRRSRNGGDDGMSRASLSSGGGHRSHRGDGPRLGIRSSRRSRRRGTSTHRSGRQPSQQHTRVPGLHLVGSSRTRPHRRSHTGEHFR